MSRTRWGMAAAAALAAGWGLAATPASAGRANDTLNIVEILPLGSLDMYYAGYPQTEFMSDMLFDALVDYDPGTKSIVPLLAKSWKVTPGAIDFELRDDVTWHDGQKFTADDVVYTLGWLIDPASRYRFKFNWAWIKKVEKTGPYSVRVETNGQRPYDLLRLTLAPMFPKHVRGVLADTTEFGKHPVGTGPYKLVSFNEATNRLVVVKNPAYKWGGTTKAAHIGRVMMSTIPDMGAQVSALLAGKADLFRNLPADQAEALAKDPRFTFSVNPSIGTTYMWFDAAGRSGNKAIANPKVRQALAMAVDRGALAKIMSANQNVEQPKNLCWPDRIIGCAFTKTEPGYHPAEAKKLLAEAGYPNGFSVHITAYVGRLSQLAEAVAGYFAQIGVKATVEPVTVTTYTKKSLAGQIEMTVAGYTLGGLPDVSQQVTFFVSAADYSGDPELKKLGAAMDAEMDPEKRLKISSQFYDRIADDVYITPLTAMPHVITHLSDLDINSHSASGYGVGISDIKWK
ncbi:MAG TPA: ABC transporter substrate-binding protein [Hyphomicrobiales bacterium]|nr:ABC transporter substrate-binding protein [Hyphomicrobiales bacterium]